MRRKRAMRRKKRWTNGHDFADVVRGGFSTQDDQPAEDEESSSDENGSNNEEEECNDEDEEVDQW